MDSVKAELLEGFSEAVPFDRASVGIAPDGQGVHVVWDREGRPLYVGQSRQTRSRLLQHLSGDRQASVLHDKVGRMLDADLGRSATAAEIRQWLEGCTVAVRETSQAEDLKAGLIRALDPEFNEIVPAPSPTRSGHGGDEWERIPELLTGVLADLRAREAGTGSADAYKRAVEVDLPAALSACVPAGFQIRGRTGMGTVAEVPWVGIFLDHNGSAQEGVYLVFLFARDGSTVYLTLNQGSDQVKRAMVVLEKRSHDIRDALPPQQDLLTTIDLKSQVDRPKKYQAGTAYAKAFGAESMPSAAEVRQSVERFVELLTKVDSSGLTFPSTEPTHLLMKWNQEVKPSTVTEHRAIAEKTGTVWWGKFGKVGTNAISPPKLEAVRAQIDAGEQTRCYLYRSGEVWQTTLHSITADPTEIDTSRLPSYYRPGDCNLFLEISDFKQLPADWAVNNLLLASRPSPDAIAGALSNQTSPLHVYERAKAHSQLPGVVTTTSHRDSESIPEQEVLDRDWLASTTLLDKDWLEDVLATLDRRPQIILAGPPGTGKTWLAKALAQYLTQGQSLAWRLVQLHPSYGYEEFIEGLRPEPSSKGIVFSRVDGVVLRMANEIAPDTDQRHVLILDEMNRANLPRVFGELMYLLEYRDEGADLAYSENFALPGRLLFIGTMNTADRSIRSIDIALRRRFEVFDCAPSSQVLKAYYQSRSCEVDDLVEGFEKLNARLTEVLDRHHTVGHTFFMAEVMTYDLLRSTWTRQLQPLFEEYFFDQPEIAETFTLEQFWVPR